MWQARLLSILGGADHAGLELSSHGDPQELRLGGNAVTVTTSFYPPKQHTSRCGMCKPEEQL
jgi:hypothetical protein